MGCWGPQLDDLLRAGEKGRPPVRALVLDNRGVGRSSSRLRRRAYSTVLMAQDILALLVSAQFSTALRNSLHHVHCSNLWDAAPPICLVIAPAAVYQAASKVPAPKRCLMSLCAGGAEAPSLGPGTRRGPLAGRHDCHAAGGAGAGARRVADARVRDRGRLAEPALLLARGKVRPAGDCPAHAIGERQACDLSHE